MNDELKNLKQEATKIRMTPAEKSAMRARIFGAPAPSPYFFFSFQFAHKVVVASLVVLVVLVGGGTSFAAASALPGDTLYSFKTNVNERVAVALAITPEAKAEAHVALAQRRIEEAEALASQGKLGQAESAALEANFDKHTNDAEEFALEVGRMDPGGAVELRAKLASSLSVHGEILAALGREIGDGEVRTNVRVFSGRVLARAETNARPAANSGTALAVRTSKTTAPAAQTMTFSADTAGGSEPATTSGEPQAAAEPVITNSTPAPEAEQERSRDSRIERRAEAALKAARGRYSDAALEQSAKAEIETHFALAESYLDDNEFEEALKIAIKLQTILEAQKKFRRDIVTPLLNLDIKLDSRVDNSSDGNEDVDN